MEQGRQDRDREQAEEVGEVVEVAVGEVWVQVEVEAVAEDNALG